MQMSAEFAGYKDNAWWWFYVYLMYGAAICEDPSIKAKSQDFTEFWNEHFSKDLGEAGVYDYKNKKKMAMPKL